MQTAQPTESPIVWLRTTVAPSCCAVARESSISKWVGRCGPAGSAGPYPATPSHSMFAPPNRNGLPLRRSCVPLRVTKGLLVPDAAEPPAAAQTGRMARTGRAPLTSASCVTVGVTSKPAWILGALALLLVVGAAPARSAAPVTFSTTATRLVIHAPGYTLTLARRNGKILELDEGSTRLTGTATRCLWGWFAGSDSSYTGGCSYAPNAERRFVYSWRASTLTLTYGGVAKVMIRAGVTSLDLRLTLVNRGTTRERVRFPDGLNGDTRTVTAGYLLNAL